MEKFKGLNPGESVEGAYFAEADTRVWVRTASGVVVRQITQAADMKAVQALVEANFEAARDFEKAEADRIASEDARRQADIEALEKQREEEQKRMLAKAEKDKKMELENADTSALPAQNVGGNK